MEPKIKEAFKKVKKDIFSLGEEIQQIRFDISDIKTDIKLITGFIRDFKEKSAKNQEKSSPNYQKPGEIKLKINPTYASKTSTNNLFFPTIKKTSTHNLPSQALKMPNIPISTGNGGVPTDRQTDRQTDRHIISDIKSESLHQIKQFNQKMPKNKLQKQNKIQNRDHLDKVSEILGNLNELKKEVRRKFKNLTPQEIAVFTLLYQLEEEGHEVSYPLLSSKLNLSESSIRDYIGRIISKGVPIIKEKIKNKQIILHISSNLKKIASLNTILKLREL